MKVEIKGKTIELKNTIKSLLLYENIAEESFTPSNLQAIIIYLYCVILGSSGDYTIQYDDVIAMLDENMDILTEFGDWLNTVTETQNKVKKNAKKGKK